jgi:hypothetical protein
VARVGEDRAVLQERLVRGGEDATRARHRDHDVRGAERLVPVRHEVPVEERPQPEHRVALDDRDDRVRVPKIRGDALAAGAVAEDRHALPVRRQVREAEERLEDALADRVLVLGELLDRAVVDHKHRQP